MGNYTKRYTVVVSDVEIHCSSKRFIKCNETHHIQNNLWIMCDMMTWMRSFQCEDIFIWFSWECWVYWMRHHLRCLYLHLSSFLILDETLPCCWFWFFVEFYTYHNNNFTCIYRKLIYETEFRNLWRYFQFMRVWIATIEYIDVSNAVKNRYKMSYMQACWKPTWSKRNLHRIPRNSKWIEGKMQSFVNVFETLHSTKYLIHESAQICDFNKIFIRICSK